MASPTDETFAYAFQLSYDGTTYTVVDGNSPTTSKVVDPTATQVEVEDPNGNKLRPGDRVDILSFGGSLDGGTKFTFVGTAQLGNNDGIIITDKQGDLFFLTDNYNATRLNNGKTDTLSNVDTTHATTICFLAGTLILTPGGEVAVETLKRGDEILTHDGRVAKVDWLGVQTVSLRFADPNRVLPVRIAAGAVAENVPSRDLLVSPDHALLIGEALIHAGALVNGTSIVRESSMPATFTYYHIEVEDHSLILANGMPAETFVDNIDRLHFDNWAEHEALYPNGKQVTELSFPRAKSRRQIPSRTRAMLDARAEQFAAVETWAA